MQPEIFPMPVGATVVEAVETQAPIRIQKHRGVTGQVIVIEGALRQLPFNRAVGFNGSVGNFNAVPSQKSIDIEYAVSFHERLPWAWLSSVAVRPLTRATALN